MKRSYMLTKRESAIRDQVHERFRKACCEQGGFRLVLATDSLIVGHYFEKLLKGCKCDHVIVGSLAELIVECGRGKVDIAVADDTLSDINAGSLVKMLASLYPGTVLIRAISVTDRKALRGNPGRRIVKPFTLMDVTHSISNALGRHYPSAIES